MAYLIEQDSQERHYLLAHHRIGRSTFSSDTAVAGQQISKLHAIIEWEYDHWNIRDTSKNGTWLNNKRLHENQRYPLKTGDLIHFAPEDNNALIVEDISAPCDLLIPCDDQKQAAIALNNYSLLPSEESPQIALYYNQKHKRWYKEKFSQNEQPAVFLKDRDTIDINGQQWMLMQNRLEDPTQSLFDRGDAVTQLKYTFKVSMDEEATQLILHIDDEKIDLQIRSHHYLSLMLARYRASDASRGLDASTQGWIYVDQLCKDLGMDQYHLNIQIHRARKQLADAISSDTPLFEIIERQPGRIRFGGNNFEIYKGDELECELHHGAEVA